MPNEIELPELNNVQCPHHPDVCECDLAGMESECSISPTLREWESQHSPLAQRECQIRELLVTIDDLRRQLLEAEAKGARFAAEWIRDNGCPQTATKFLDDEILFKPTATQ